MFWFEFIRLIYGPTMSLILFSLSHKIGPTCMLPSSASIPSPPTPSSSLHLWCSRFSHYSEESKPIKCQSKRYKTLNSTESGMQLSYQSGCVNKFPGQPWMCSVKSKQNLKKRSLTYNSRKVTTKPGPWSLAHRIFGTTRIEPPSRPLSAWDDPQYKPYFDDSNVDNVTTQLGKTAYLHCKIRQLGDRTVSWVRQKDLHILTVGRYTYTSDQRFTCIHLDDSDDWALEIKYIQKDDAGIYECQVSTEPKMSLSIKLNVIAAKAIIPEGPELHTESGTTINLTCVITDVSSPPVYVFWYHEGTVINYDSPRGGIKVTTDKGSNIVSRLTITDLRPSDSGDYSCKPSFADFANITIHVINKSVPKKSSTNSEESSSFYQYPSTSSAYSLSIVWSLSLYCNRIIYCSFKLLNYIVLTVFTILFNKKMIYL